MKQKMMFICGVVLIALTALFGVLMVVSIFLALWSGPMLGSSKETVNAWWGSTMWTLLIAVLLGTIGSGLIVLGSDES